MTKSLIAIAFALAAFTMPAPAHAEVQPSEHADRTKCDAAWEANDWPGVIVHCTAEAKDHARDAYDETDEEHFTDLGIEAACLIYVVHANREEGNAHDAVTAAQTARDLLNAIVAGSTDSDSVALARKQLALLKQEGF